MQIPIEALYPNEEVTMDSFIIPGRKVVGGKWKLTPQQKVLIQTMVEAAEDSEHGFYLLPKDLEFFKRVISDSEYREEDRVWLQCGVVHYFNHRHSDRISRYSYPMEIHKKLHYGIK